MAEDSVFFLGEHEHGVDLKRRVQIPSKWRSASGVTRFVLMRWRPSKSDPACILGMAPALMTELVDKMKQDRRFFDPRAEKAKRTLSRAGEIVDLDSAGRIALPVKLMEAAGLEVKKGSVLIGMMDRFQIWSPEHYALVTRDDDESYDEVIQYF